MSEKSPFFPQVRVTSHPLRVLAFFAVGIILPSIFLSYLGFRSLRVENMLQRKQAEERYAAVADLLQRKAGEWLSGLVHELQKTVVAQLHRDETFGTHIEHLLGITVLGHVPLQGLLLFDLQGHAVLPRISTSSNNVLSSSRLDWGNFSSDIRRLEHTEFVNRNVEAAVQGYEALRSRTSNPILQAALLKNIAGGYRKLHDFKKTESYYLELIRRYDQVEDPVGYPTGLLARKILTNFYQETSRPAQSLGMRLDILEGLIVGQWILSAKDRDALRAETATAISQELTSGGPGTEEGRARLGRLLILEARLAALRPVIENFLQSDWTDLERRIKMHNGWEQGGIFQTKFSHRLVVAGPIPDPTQEGRRLLAVAFGQAPSFLKEIEHQVNDIAQTAGLRLDWSSMQNTGEGSIENWAKSLRVHVERSVNLVDPPLPFRLWEADASPQEYFRRRREGIFIGMIGLSLLVIVAGFIVMTQAVKREMEVANLKSDFVANVSHELRTPLSAIAYIGERLSGGRYRSSEEAKEFYDMLGEETVRLREMIEDILDFSKMLDGRKVYKKESHNLADVAQEALDRIRGKANGRGVTLITELPNEPVTVWLDLKTTVQAISNLLDNAIKYSGDSKDVHLKVTRRDGYGVIQVLDKGIGISPDQFDKVFEKFYRVEDSMTRASDGGVGLGLAMVKHIMEGHGGRVTLESILGQGSTFTLWFNRSEK